jgi:hypothetical protein
MSERSTLLTVIMALFLGSRIPQDIGEGAFHALLWTGLAVVFAWSIVAWRKGEVVFIWQRKET